MHAFDRQTDRNLIVRPRLHSMQRGKNAKLVLIKLHVFIKDKLTVVTAAVVMYEWCSYTWQDMGTSIVE